MVRLDRTKDEVVEAIAAHGPYDLVVDYLRGAPAAAAFDRMLGLVAEGGIVLDAEAVPLAVVEDAWTRRENGRRIVFVP
ncbi:hypothetical protein [Actinomadura montaniterrae]|uniref:Zinc-binding dehydrogenase n=1 Tax=Actinomadura montaniterrae TaxID=1803903 RepID=A0A6L3VT65_9ACTN|nr:hypothetical protein [Actinomadura montaniterrae]KAB2380672.1 hypothetical protein F9B16_17380 [Actinomadura montaniterrae]